MSKVITIDARVSGYLDSAVRVLAVCMPETGMILLQKEGKYKDRIKKSRLEFDDQDSYDQHLAKIANTVLVTDSPSHFDNWQLAFDEKQHMQDAIRTYFQKKRGGYLKIESTLAKYDPEQVLQVRKVDKSGAEYDFDGAALNNGHMAVLLAVWASARANMGHLLAGRIDDDSDADLDPDDPMMPFSLRG
jgi:hypothetical protein